MTIWLLMLVQPQGAEWEPGATGTAFRGILSLLVVIGLIALLAWLVRRGSLGAFGLTPGRMKGPVSVEVAVPLGERRSLMIVAVEGRRLLLGLTPAQVSLVTELGDAPVPSVPDAAGFDRALDRRLAPGRPS